MPRLQAKSFSVPDEVREMDLARFETVGLEEAVVGHCTFSPGWRWSTAFGPVFGAASCPVRHVGYTIAGAVHVRMDDGQSMDIGPGTVFDIPPGHDKWVVGDEPWETIEWGGSGRAVAAALREAPTRSFATVLFTDVVESTSTVARIGDEAWHQLLVAHNARLRLELNAFRGREVKTTGDGLLAVFDSPTRAARAAAAMVRSTDSSGLAIRVGMHTGEVELAGGDIRGIAVHLAARVLAKAGRQEVWLSSTTKELLEGSDLIAEDVGLHELKGIDGARRLYRLQEPT